MESGVAVAHFPDARPMAKAEETDEELAAVTVRRTCRVHSASTATESEVEAHHLLDTRPTTPKNVTPPKLVVVIGRRTVHPQSITTESVVAGDHFPGTSKPDVSRRHVAHPVSDRTGLTDVEYPRLPNRQLSRCAAMLRPNRSKIQYPRTLR